MAHTSEPVGGADIAFSQDIVVEFHRHGLAGNCVLVSLCAVDKRHVREIVNIVDHHLESAREQSAGRLPKALPASVTRACGCGYICIDVDNVLRKADSCDVECTLALTFAQVVAFGQTFSGLLLLATHLQICNCLGCPHSFYSRRTNEADHEGGNVRISECTRLCACLHTASSRLTPFVTVRNRPDPDKDRNAATCTHPMTGAGKHILNLL